MIGQPPSCPHTHTPSHSEPDSDSHAEGYALGPSDEREDEILHIPDNDKLIGVTDRRRRRDAGEEGEKRVKYLLEEKLGHRGRVTRGVGLESSGAEGLPDLLLKSPPAVYAVEVKSINPWRVQASKWKVSQAPLSRSQWEAISKWAQLKRFKTLLIVEVKVRASEFGHLYFFIKGRDVDKYIETLSPGVLNIRISLFDLACLSSLTVRPGRWIVGDWRP